MQQLETTRVRCDRHLDAYYEPAQCDDCDVETARHEQELADERHQRAQARAAALAEDRTNQPHPRLRQKAN